MVETECSGLNLHLEAYAFVLDYERQQLNKPNELVDWRFQVHARTFGFHLETLFRVKKKETAVYDGLLHASA